MHRLKKPIWMFAAEAGGDGGDGGADGGPGGGSGSQDGGKSEDAFTQADVDRIVADRLKREREATKTKYADYDALKAKAEGAKTAEERIAALEGEISAAKVEALRAKYAADVPERMRPLLTGSNDEELKAQRDLILEAESERKRQGNRVPGEGRNHAASAGDERETVRSLFGAG